MSISNFCQQYIPAINYAEEVVPTIANLLVANKEEWLTRGNTLPSNYFCKTSTGFNEQKTC